MLGLAGAATLGALLSSFVALPRRAEQRADQQDDPMPQTEPTITMFLCGDVMTGRGIDQVLPHAGDPRIHEQAVQDARRYVKLAEQVSGPIEQPVDFAYMWGDALDELKLAQPDARIINLETAVTSSDAWWKGKGINYRMHPDNVPCLTAADIDCCALANNHVLDWGYEGLEQTLETLEKVGIKAAGAGRNRDTAESPAIIDVAEKARLIVFSFGATSSGIPRQWAASGERAGVALIEDLSDAAAERIAAQVRSVKRSGDVVVVSLHWGGNWGYKVPDEQRAFAHKLIDDAGVDVVHGHSSHHPKGIEVHRNRLILYGCGDFINDYEGIRGYEKYRAELGLMYFPSVDAKTGKLMGLRMLPTRIRQFQVRRAAPDDAKWLLRMLNREGRKLGTGVVKGPEGDFSLHWT